MLPIAANNATPRPMTADASRLEILQDTIWTNESRVTNAKCLAKIPQPMKRVENYQSINQSINKLEIQKKKKLE